MTIYLSSENKTNRNIALWDARSADPDICRNANAEPYLDAHCPVINSLLICYIHG